MSAVFSVVTFSGRSSNKQPLRARSSPRPGGTVLGVRRVLSVVTFSGCSEQATTEDTELTETECTVLGVRRVLHGSFQRPFIEQATTEGTEFTETRTYGSRCPPCSPWFLSAAVHRTSNH